jgi:hypothetical protein
MLYEVRCCCQPDKLLGWFEVSAQERAAAMTQGYFEVKLPSDEPTTVPWIMRQKAHSEPGPVIVRTVKVQKISVPDKGSYLAIYGEDHPIEYWRDFPTFLECRYGE